MYVSVDHDERVSSVGKNRIDAGAETTLLLVSVVAGDDNHVSSNKQQPYNVDN